MLDLYKEKEIETSYAYLIQFILYKVLVDNGYKKFINEYQKLLRCIKKSIHDCDFYNMIVKDIREISEYISQKIYKPFAKEQEEINKKITENLKQDLTIDDISPWLDVIVFINKYNFANLKNEIFGFIYENYLKDLYGDENKGQYFTDPDIVNFMLEEIGYTSEELVRNKDKISIIDPSCGAGTFLYSAVDRIVEAFEGSAAETESKTVKELVNKNIFGLDIAEFPLFLAEMSILMRLLPLIVNDNYENPIDNKLKIFKTKDSISEFLDAGLVHKQEEIDYPLLFSQTDLGYKSFMRDNKDLQEMIESMQGHNGQRMRFDYVVGNPPYIGYNECCKQGIEFTKKIKNKENASLTMGNVYGVNLHSVPNHSKKYRPNPNSYAFFIALGLALLKNHGKISLIIPQTLLTAGDFDVLRYHLSKNMTIEKIITFEGNLFIGRGLKQNKFVATSSLIFVVKKENAAAKHNVKITNYKPYTEKQSANFGVYLRSKNKITKKILQTELLNNFENWNFIKQDNHFLELSNFYKNNTNKISSYYQHDLAENNFQSYFWFDGGYNIDEKKISAKPSDYIYPKINNSFYTIKDIRGYWSNIREGNSPQKIGLRQGNQGYNLLDSPYKIVWSYANAQRFFFTDKPLIWARNQFNAIGSDNKNELLYLFSLLNSSVNFLILKKHLKMENEKGFLLSEKSIKQYIRIPKITAKNQFIKNEIIKQTETMLDLENVLLKNLVNFSGLNIQKFDNIKVSGNNLILTRHETDYQCKIVTGKSDFVQKIIAETYFDNGIFLNKEINLSELKNLSAIDFEEQSAIKDYVDDLVFALYFNISLSKSTISEVLNVKKLCKKNEFYEQIIHTK